MYIVCIFLVLLPRIPVRNIFSHMEDGVVAVAMSSDAQYVAVITIGDEQVRSDPKAKTNKQNNNNNKTTTTTTKQQQQQQQQNVYHNLALCNLQRLSVWEWTVESEDPLCFISLSEDYSYQTFITFHPNNPHQLISNSGDMVVFYYWVGINFSL